MRNTITQEEIRDEYLARVESLYARLRQWIGEADPQARVEEETITLVEEPVDPYQAKVLAIHRPSYKTIRLIPRGRWIIGAEGRVDLKSDLGTETLLYTSEGGPRIRIDEMTEDGKFLGTTRPLPLAEDVAEGWVFLQNRQVGLLPSLDADLFCRLLEVLGR